MVNISLFKKNLLQFLYLYHVSISFTILSLSLSRSRFDKLFYFFLFSQLACVDSQFRLNFLRQRLYFFFLLSEIACRSNCIVTYIIMFTLTIVLCAFWWGIFFFFAFQSCKSSSLSRQFRAFAHALFVYFVINAIFVSLSYFISSHSFPIVVVVFFFFFSWTAILALSLRCVSGVSLGGADEQATCPYLKPIVPRLFIEVDRLQYQVRLILLCFFKKKNILVVRIIFNKTNLCFCFCLFLFYIF